MELQNGLDLFYEFSACEHRWKKARVPNDKEFNSLLKIAKDLEIEMQILKNRQPDCVDLLGKYESEFAKYREKVKKTLRKNDHALHQLDAFVFTKEKLESLRDEINTLIEIRKENRHLLDTRLIECTARVLWSMLCFKRELENTKSQLFTGLEKIRQELEKNQSMLNHLLEPTHIWVIVESPKKELCTRCSKEIDLEEIEKNTEKAAEELRKKIKRVRDSEIL